MKSPIMILVFILSFLYSCNSAVESPYPDLILEQKSGLPDGGLSSAVAFVIDNKAYITLGRTDTLNNNCYEYNPVANSWTLKSVFPGAGRVNAIAATVNGCAYLGLGYTPIKQIYHQESYLKDLWKYNPVDDSWTKLADYPAFSTDKPISFVFNNEIYIGYGFRGTSFAEDMWKYSPLTDTWTQLNIGKAISRAVAVVCTDGSSVFFGTGYRTMNLNDWWQYFPETETWEKRKAMPDNGRVNAVALSLENRYFVATGRYFGGSLTGGHLKNDIMEFDDVKNVWYYRGSLNKARENAVSFVLNGKAYIGFGETDSTVLNDLWCFKL